MCSASVGEAEYGGLSERTAAAAHALLCDRKGGKGGKWKGQKPMFNAFSFFGV